MDSKHKKSMTTNRVYLVENLMVDEKFLSYFSDGEVLLDNHIEEIMVKATKAEKVGEFLRIIQRRGPQAMGRLMEALHRTGQGHVADQLDFVLSSDVKATIGMPYGQRKNNIQESGGGGYFPIGGAGDEEPNLEDGGLPFIDVKVKLIDPSNPAIRGLLNDKLVYKIQRKKRSRALIINNENFLDGTKLKLSDREGSNYDMINLNGLLTQLDFDTVFKSDLTAKQIVEAIDTERRHPDHADADGFILAIFSHGAQGSIYGNDGKPVMIEDIKSSFDGRGCKALAGKPKLFIIQACQGKQSTQGVPQADADSGDGDNGEDELAAALRKLKLGDEDTQDAVPWTTVELSMGHEKGDILVAYSTVEGYKSWRLPSEGSWFIRTLVKIFMHYAHREHVVDLLTRVRNAVGNKQTGMRNDGSGLFVQMTRNDDTFSKKWYFFPGPLPQTTF